MRRRRIIGIGRGRKVETTFAAIYERQSEEGRARLLAFCHLIELAAPLAIRFEIQPSGEMALSLEVAAPA